MNCCSGLLRTAAGCCDGAISLSADNGTGGTVTIFVEIAPDEYDATAFDAFNAAATGFEIGNARALMWISQLAYETHAGPTIDMVSGKWGFSSVEPFTGM